MARSAFLDKAAPLATLWRGWGGLALWLALVVWLAIPLPELLGAERTAPAAASNSLRPGATAPVAPEGEAPTEQPRDDTEVIASIDEQIRAGWQSLKLSPSRPASDAVWCRRVYLDLLGRIPRVEELEAYLSDRGRDRQARLVDRLLESDETLDEFASHWAVVWTNWLIGRTAGTEPRSVVNRAGLEQYLRRALAGGKPYDQLAQELISAEGCNKPGTEDFHGAVNFLIGMLEDKAVQATSTTSRLFLGLQVQCTQCHHHPTNNWQQSQFWGLNAFFRQATALRTTQGRDVVEARLGDQDFAGEGGSPTQAEVYYEIRNGQLEAVFPTFVDGRQIEPNGFVRDLNWRDELAELIVSSEYFAPALVNRLWGYFLGYGFTRPVDDMGPHNPPTHPELLAQLSRDLKAHRFDLRRLMRWIVLSEAYQLSSASNDNNADDDPALGAKPRFSHFYLRQMSAEQLYQSLLVATQADRAAGTTPEERDRRRRDWLRQFAVAFGNDEGGEVTTFDGTIPQALMMMNGDLVREATSDQPGSLLADLAASPLKPEERIDRLYLAALSRKPTKRERTLALELWRGKAPQAVEPLQDVWWALLNANEFVLNH